MIAGRSLALTALLVEHDSLHREALNALLRESSKIQITKAKNLDEALNMVKKYTPNIVLVNLCFDDESDMDAFTWIALTREISPITKILGYTSTPTRYQAAEAFRAGASGYYATQRGPDELLKAIETLMQNVKATYCEKMVSDIITDVLAVKLTVKQREVLKHIGLGKSTKAIAHDLILGETTIKTHLGNIFQMLNLESRTEAALFAVATGMVSPRRVSLALEIS